MKVFSRIHSIIHGRGPACVGLTSRMDRVLRVPINLEVLPSVEHQQHHYLNNRANTSYQSLGERERGMPRFKSPGQAQRFLSAVLEGASAPTRKSTEHTDASFDRTM